jgi:hypothetical protein
MAMRGVSPVAHIDRDRGLIFRHGRSGSSTAYRSGAVVLDEDRSGRASQVPPPRVISDVMMVQGVATVRLRIPVLVPFLLVAFACHSALVPRYIVTTAPIDVGVRQGGLCVAVDPGDPQGVWWWEPGESGCSSRSTGPGIFRADEATVMARTQSAIEVRFRLGLHGDSTMPSVVDVRLAIQDSHMLAAATGARVTTVRRNDLEVPGQPDSHSKNQPSSNRCRPLKTPRERDDR